MTWNSLTERTRAALFEAQGLAAARGDTLITPEYLLAGLCRLWQSEASDVLAEFGLGPESLLQGALALLPGVAGAVRPREQALSEAGRLVLEGALEEARSLPDDRGLAVFTDHLLLGLLRERDSAAAGLLRERGLTLVGVREVCARRARARKAVGGKALGGLLAA